MEAGTEKVRCPWNKGKLVGQKLPLKTKEIWAVRFRLQLEHRTRDLALFNLGIDSKLRGCDLVTLRVRDVVQGDRVCARAIVMQQKTRRPVKFEITEQTRDAVGAWVAEAGLRSDDFLFPSRIAASPHLTTRQHGRILKSWEAAVGLDPHGGCRTEAALRESLKQKARHTAGLRSQITTADAQFALRRLSGPAPWISTIPMPLPMA